MTSLRQANISCEVCKSIPDTFHLNFMEAEPDIPQMYKFLQGWEGQSLSRGYQNFLMACPICHTKYLAEIDVEALVWDFDVTRLAGRMKDYKGYYMPIDHKST